MAEVAPQPAEASKKRKRTGKQREEAKRLAIQAKLDAVTSQADDTKEVNDEATTATEIPSADIAEPPAPSVDLDKLTSRVPTALKHLHPTFKQARTFETRRLIKKIRFLRSKSASSTEVTDLEAQLALLSHLTLNPTIQSHLLLKLRKHPKLRNTTLPPTATDLLTPSATSSTSDSSLLSKVENRICSSKAVAESVKATVGWLVGEEGAKLISRTKTPSVRSTERSRPEQEAGDDEVLNEDKSFNIGTGTRIAASSDEEESDEEGVLQRQAGWESGSVSDIDQRPHGDNPQSEPESESESESESTIALPLPSSTKRPTPAKPTKSAKVSNVHEPITSSTFLPTLSAGFTLGSDDSDPDLEYDPDGIIGTSKPERKNRRGQRARQAIWEKKYGRGAKHVVKARETELQQGMNDHGHGHGHAQWGTDGGTRGERGGRGGRGRGMDRGWGTRGGGISGRGGFGSTGQTDSQPTSTVTRQPQSYSQPKTSTSLHPSWEAARLRKQKEMAAAPQATKIVFD
ncbi:Bud-site selection protein [Naematelia encephala]|uniref:Bud-site selection protein n=1 Tax=Naematelia encephala TaxID=71784 RepID=A0A1Y2B608_9TREE|nr:Bud-site selection protein [Naematelia encephala]